MKTSSNQSISGWMLWSVWMALIVVSICLMFWTNLKVPKSGACGHKGEGSLIPSASQPAKVEKLNSTPKPEGVILIENTTPQTLKIREGFGLSTMTNPQEWAAKLGAGWYLDWRVQKRRSFQVPEHFQMIRLSIDCHSPSDDVIKWTAIHFPGQVWIIGNEPDVIWQDSISAEEYARAYHELYFLIKSSDPSSKIAVAGVAQGTPLRLAYLDDVLTAYRKMYGDRLPVDWWTVHGFVLREQKGSWGVEIPPGMNVEGGELYEVADHGRIDLFENQINLFRGWMKINGYRERPLALTEFGIIMPPEYGFSDGFVKDYINQTFTWLAQARDQDTGYPADDNRLVQRWAWFSLADKDYPAPDLADLTTRKLTTTGLAFRNWVDLNHR
jgi:hypothetical protein